MPSRALCRAATMTDRESTCMIDGRPAVVDVQAPVTLDGHTAPAGRHTYPPMRITLCAEHAREYHDIEPASVGGAS